MISNTGIPSKVVPVPSFPFSPYIYRHRIRLHMSDEFKVDSEGFTSDGYRRLESSSLKSMYIGNLIEFAIVAVIAAAAYFYAPRFVAPYEEITRMAILVLTALFAMYLLVGPQVFYRRYRYRIDDDKLEIRKGILVISHKLVPVERIHQVEVSRGPVNRMFGLANVNITTAGGTAVLEYLADDVAEGVAERLNQCVVSLLRERE